MLIPNKHSGYLAGIRLYHGSKGGGSSAPAPDPALIQAQIKSMGIQDSAIQQVIQNSSSMLPLQKEQMQFGLDTSKTAYNQAQDDRNWSLGRRGELTGMQNTMINDAKAFNSDARQQQLAAQAGSDVTQAFGNVKDQQSRALSRNGVNPSSGRALTMGNQTSIAQAAAMAGGVNKSRQAARAEGMAMTDRASNALAGYPSMGMQATGAGQGYGASGIGMTNSGLQGMNSGFGSAGTMAGQMGNNASGMYGAMGSYKNGQDQINQGESMGSLLGGLGGLAAGGATAGWWSDRRLKENIELVGKDQATGLNIYEFNYTKAPHNRFRGVMADEVELFMPDAVTRDEDGYARVNYSAIGIDMVEV